MALNFQTEYIRPEGALGQAHGNYDSHGLLGSVSVPGLPCYVFKLLVALQFTLAPNRPCMYTSISRFVWASGWYAVSLGALNMPFLYITVQTLLLSPVNNGTKWNKRRIDYRTYSNTTYGKNNFFLKNARFSGKGRQLLRKMLISYVRLDHTLYLINYDMLICVCNLFVFHFGV